MFDSAQPQADEPANQPGIETETESSASLAADDMAYEAGTPDGDAYNAGKAAAAQPDAGADAAADDAPFLTVKYNKQEMPLSKEAVVTYAQKGMNYDKLSARLQEASAKLGAYEDNDFFRIAQAYSEKSGRPVGDVMASMRSQIASVHGCADDKQAVVDAQLGEFMRAYPGIDPRLLPDGVLDAWGTGVPLREAFLAYQAGAYRDEAVVLRQKRQQERTNHRNAQASMGRPRSRGRAHARALSDDVIQTMSPRELERDHERIWAYLTGADKERR